MYADKLGTYFKYSRTDIAPLLPDRLDRVLEIGFGAGATMQWLRGAHHVPYAVGIELSPDAAELATAAFDLVLTGDIERMALPAEKFDLIIALDVLEHLVDPWSVIRRLHAILHEDGAIIVSIPNISHYSVSVPLVLRGRFNYTEEGLLDRTHLRFFTSATVVDLLTSSGLLVDKMEQVRRGPQFTTAKRRWWALQLLTWFLPAHLLAYQFLVRLKMA